VCVKERERERERESERGWEIMGTTTPVDAFRDSVDCVCVCERERE